MAELDLARYVRPGDTVVVAQCASEPQTLSEALVAQADRLGALTVFLGAVYSDSFPVDRAPGLRYVSYGAMGAGNAKLARAGRLEVVPCHYSQLPWLFASGRWKADVVLLGLSPMHDGVATLGPTHGFMLAAAARARVVLAEVNEAMPWVRGAELPSTVEPAARIETSRPLPRFASPVPGELERGVAQQVAALIPDGATLQLGIGAIPDALAVALAGHRDLGLHSGMLTGSVLPLIEQGVVTNARKGIDPGVSVAGFLVGDERFYRMAHRNPSLRIAPPTYTHDPAVIAQLPGFVSVNSAVEVDLFGNVNAETAGSAYVGGIGGQLDFARGAARAPGGRAIIALPSVSRDGKTSRIVARCATVTSPAAEADTVVTEWGAAELRGVSYEERARRLVAIAHPSVRDGLAEQTRKLP